MPKNYQLGSVLSYGSEGIVHSGTWRGTIAAIKVLSNQYARRVESEVKLVMDFNHVNIIKYYDLDYEQGKAYVAMEFISGGNLFEFIQKNFTSTSYWTTVDKVLRDVAHGIMYLHDRRIVQGDLKSHNILLREDTYQAVICDFGISRSLDYDNQEKKRANTTKGTIRWMAPELCAPPPEPSSYSSDVWSYGCIILEITSAREPWIDQFNDDSLLFRALQRRDSAPIFARLCENQSGPEYLRQLLIQCCTWSKIDRPRFTDILQKFNTDEHEKTSMDDPADSISIDSPFKSNIQSSFEKNDGDVPTYDYKENIRSPSVEIQDYVPKSINHQGRLTGELYTSKGTASGQPIYEGVKGGRYYLTSSGSKVYLHK